MSFVIRTLLVLCPLAENVMTSPSAEVSSEEPPLAELYTPPPDEDDVAEVVDELR